MMKNFEYFIKEDLNNGKLLKCRYDIKELKNIISQLPDMRWNIAERDESNSDFPYGYFGDEWDNWEHMEENERAEYFGQMFSTIKKLKDKIESL